MKSRTVFRFVAGALGLAGLIAFIPRSERAMPPETQDVSISFELADMEQGDIDEWRRLIDICETAPGDSNRFESFGAGPSMFYFDIADGLLCSFRDYEPVRVYLTHSDLPATHQFSVSTVRGRTHFQLGPIPDTDR